ncbi:MAG: hypothetical protein M3R26_04435 [Actinomycetota bacterium]|nr:hypothetical protein [Actinomycetota bacterium]
MAETRARTTWPMERYAPLTGVGAVVCWVVGLIIMGDLSNKDKGTELLAYYKAHDGRILLGTIIWVIGTLLFFWFLGSLRSRLAAAEGGDLRLTTLAFGGGVATAICIALNVGPDAAAAISKDDLDASAARAIHTLGDAFFLGAEYFLVILLVATALNALRTRVFPAWYAWLSLLIALVLLIAIIGWAALIFAFPIWVLITVFLLWRPATAARTANP